jgi:glutaminyl-tRNA synthetase
MRAAPGALSARPRRRIVRAPMSSPESPPRVDDGPKNFVEDLVRADVAAGRQVVTRFPPEPNGYLHVGHAKSLCLNFGLARDFGGRCHLRFDDTNPEKEQQEFVDSIQASVKWLGFDWGENLFFASDYFDKLYDFAVGMIERGEAYVDSRSLDEIREARGDFHRVGVDSPHRSRTPAENLDLFRRMRAGEFPDGAHVLRAKGDMADADVKMRDPVLYRIRHAHHHRTGDAWCIYPMYDWAHGQSDFIEGITHSICTLEFVNHRPLYNFLLDKVGAKPGARPQQIEFAKLQLTYTMLSKRKLQELVEKKLVDGWDDPRMPTLAGMRRRGVTPEALRAFCDRVGVSTRDSVVDVTLFEHALREDLNARSPRAMAVLRPLEVVIENLPEGEVIELDAPWHAEPGERAEQPGGPTRKVPLTRRVYIDRDDFAEVPPKKWQRLSPGAEVRLRYACLITCTAVEKDQAGNVVRLRATWDPRSKGGAPADGRKVKGTLHWVSADKGARATVRLYDRLFKVENPMKDEDWIANLNPQSLEAVDDAIVEPALASAAPLDRYQFERVGYFCADEASKPGALVFNRTIGLRDAWAAATKA